MSDQSRLEVILGARIVHQVGDLALVKAGAASNDDCIWVYDVSVERDVPQPIVFLSPTEIRRLADALYEIAGAE